MIVKITARKRLSTLPSCGGYTYPDVPCLSPRPGFWNPVYPYSARVSPRPFHWILIAYRTPIANSIKKALEYFHYNKIPIASKGWETPVGKANECRPPISPIFEGGMTLPLNPLVLFFRGVVLVNSVRQPCNFPLNSLTFAVVHAAVVYVSIPVISQSSRLFYGSKINSRYVFRALHLLVINLSDPDLRHDQDAIRSPTKILFPYYCMIMCSNLLYQILISPQKWSWF